MFIYKYIVISFLIVWLVYKFLKKDYDLFAITIFLAPFSAIYMNIGLNLSAFQISQIFLILSTVIALAHNRKRNLIDFKNKYILFFIIYTITSTMIISIFFIDDYMELGSWFRSEGRFISQIILLLLTYSLIIIAFNYIKKIEDVYKYLRILLNGMIILAIFGWVQLTIYIGSGVDIFPLGLRDGVIFSGIEQKLGLFRMSSLSHEPKGLSVFMIIAFFILHVLNYSKIQIYKYDILVKILFIVTAFATLATSGIVMFFIIGFVYYLLVLKEKRSISIKTILVSFLLFGILITLAIEYQSELYELIKIRILDRNIISEDFDAPIQLFLLNNPQYFFFGTGLGNIHNFTTQYISYEHIHYMADQIIVAKSGYLRFVSELGLIGFLLFILMNYSIWRKLKRASALNIGGHQNVFTAFSFLLILIFMGLMARSYVMNEFIVIFAIANVMAYFKLERKNI